MANGQDPFSNVRKELSLARESLDNTKKITQKALDTTYDALNIAINEYASLAEEYFRRLNKSEQEKDNLRRIVSNLESTVTQKDGLVGLQKEEIKGRDRTITEILSALFQREAAIARGVRYGSVDIMIDPNYQVGYVSKKVAKILGYPTTEIEGNFYFDLFEDNKEKILGYLKSESKVIELTMIPKQDREQPEKKVRVPVRVRRIESILDLKEIPEVKIPSFRPYFQLRTQTGGRLWVGYYFSISKISPFWEYVKTLGTKVGRGVKRKWGKGGSKKIETLEEDKKDGLEEQQEKPEEQESSS